MSPDVQRLCARLADAPPVFRAPVEPNRTGCVKVAAVVADLFRDRATRPPLVKELAALKLPPRKQAKARKAARRHLSVVLLACWLLHDEAFEGVEAEALFALLSERLGALSQLVAAGALLEDPDRREELVRVVLDALSLRPAGEDPKDAEDRLAALDSVQRQRLMADARKRAQERRKAELERLRRQEEEARRQAARTTFED